MPYWNYRDGLQIEVNKTNPINWEKLPRERKSQLILLLSELTRRLIKNEENTSYEGDKIDSINEHKDSGMPSGSVGNRLY